MSAWLTGWHEGDIQNCILTLTKSRRSFALATIIVADGGPRTAGSQMLVTQEGFIGFLSGGCIEADVVIHGRETLASGIPKRLVYGTGSPFIDMRLPCGGRLEILVERVGFDDAALAGLVQAIESRTPAGWASNGYRRNCCALPSKPDPDLPIIAEYRPVRQLAVIGNDPFALAIAAQGACLGWRVYLLSPFGPNEPPPLSGLIYIRDPIASAFAAVRPDQWTAVAIATHDLELDHAVLMRSLASSADYIGVLGSRKRISERFGRLLSAGIDSDQLRRIHAPIGLDIGAQSPGEIGTAVISQIIIETFRADPSGVTTINAAESNHQPGLTLTPISP